LPHGDFELQCRLAVAENQPATKNRMKSEFSNFAARLRERISVGDDARNLILQNRKSEIGNRKLSEPPHVGSYDDDFNRFALELFALQFEHNAACRKICEARRLTPQVVEHWTQIPAVPTAAFKELELTCLPPNERTVVFHSSGTTEQKPSRHFHSPESLKLYEASLIPWFLENVLLDLRFAICDLRLVCLTPPPAQAPHSSLVHMFETVRSRVCESADHSFFGTVAADGSWTFDYAAALAALSPKSQTQDPRPYLLLGPAFSFVHLLDFLEEKNLRFNLPAGSRVMETGGYKNRSRSMPKAELHALITERLGVPPESIICEYGMSELSSQAYDNVTSDKCHVTREIGASRHPSPATRHFRFPPWARVQIISPETGREVADGETGLIRVFDLANVFSVMAIQTQDLGVRCGKGFELIGRAQLAEQRGCSLMTA
jgi:hypothetical protein